MFSEQSREPLKITETILGKTAELFYNAELVCLESKTILFFENLDILQSNISSFHMVKVWQMIVFPFLTL